MRKMKTIAPNQCSGRRWLAVALLTVLGGVLLTVPLVAVEQSTPGLLEKSVGGIPFESLYNLLSFPCFFFPFVLALRRIAGTGLKDFILGEGGRADKKQILIFALLQVVGVVLSFLPTLSYLSWRGVALGTFVLLVVLMVPLVWVQTSVEEFLFRGLFLRWACKNNIGYSAKALAAMIPSTVLFALMHAGNVEISAMGGFDYVLGLATYLIPGLVCFWADIHFGSLVPGMVIHWVNNLILSVLISSQVSSMPTPTLFVDSSPMAAVPLFLTNLLAYVPAMGYILYDLLRTRRARREEKES